MSGERYAFSMGCTWHGPLTLASLTVWAHPQQPEYACPKCGQPLTVTSKEAFWQSADRAAKAIPQYIEMLKWAEGKCFPDYSTMLGAYRQAMEGM